MECLPKPSSKSIQLISYICCYPIQPLYRHVSLKKAFSLRCLQCPPLLKGASTYLKEFLYSIHNWWKPLYTAPSEKKKLLYVPKKKKKTFPYSIKLNYTFPKYWHVAYLRMYYQTKLDQTNFDINLNFPSLAIFPTLIDMFSFQKAYILSSQDLQSPEYIIRFSLGRWIRRENSRWP